MPLNRHEGDTRIVYVGDAFAVKIPKFRRIIFAFKYMLQNVRRFSKKDGLSAGIDALKRWYVDGGEHAHWSPQWAIGGILANFREGIIPPELEDIIVPTKLSIFGLINFQDVTDEVPLPITDSRLEKAFEVALGREDYYQDCHAFAQTVNFGLHEGKIKMRDCGGKHTLKFLEKHQSEVRAALTQLTQLCAVQRTL